MNSQQSHGKNLISALYRSLFSRSDGPLAQQREYFTPRLADADRHLYALAVHLRGTYRRGALDGAAFARQAADAGAVWGPGSRVRKRMHGLDLEVTLGVERLSTGEPGEPTHWRVLVPGVTLTPARRDARRPRVDPSWSLDEESARGAARLRLLRDRDAAAEAALAALPAALVTARRRLIERASKLTCREGRVFVAARPLSRAPGQPRELGHGSFELGALLDLIDRARAFAHALAS